MMPSGLTPSRFRPETSVSQVWTVKHGDAGIRLAGVDGGVGLDGGLASREGLRLDDLWRFGDPDRQRAVADGDARDPHVAADDDGAGAFVDDDARRRVGLDDHVLDLGIESGRRNVLRLANDDRA